MSHLTQTGLVAFALVAHVTGACSGAEQQRSAGGDGGGTDSATLAASTATTKPRVSNVMIGKRIGPGNRITEPTFEFTPRDTVHVSVAVEGTGGSESLTAAWRSQSGQIVDQSVQTVPPKGENAVFDLSQPKGFKPGTYKVVLFLGGDSVDAKVFVVKK
ncbi:MAG: hypothetical protein ACAI18_15990 [Gemmatimonadales bacterium]